MTGSPIVTDTTTPATESSRKLKKILFALGLGGVGGFLGTLGFMRLADSGAIGSLGASREIAGLVAIVYIVTALGIVGGVLAPGAGAKFLNVEDADELREQRFQLIASGVGMAAMGGALLVAALAAPVGPIGAGLALAISVGLMVVTVATSFASYARQDELMRSIGRDTAGVGFYIVVLVGGGWSLAAHLGYAAGPAPLDWLTMFWGLLLVAAFIVVGRRGMLAVR